MERYVLGLDFGTLSARAAVFSASDGRSLGESVSEYAHGVFDRTLPCGEALKGADWALADPLDYWDALVQSVRGAVEASGVPNEAIGVLAMAATACTLMPVDAHLTPLCALPEFKRHPQAYAKLWKHHRAQPYADLMTRAAEEMDMPFLSDYGGRISSEWAIPKVLETLSEDPAVYRAADRFMQFSDWLTARLTGDANAQNGSIAAYKTLWSKREGYPPDEYLSRAHPSACEIVREKLRGRMCMAGERAGFLTRDAADALGLTPGIVVGMAHTDAHAAALGVGVADEGDYAYILGTSSCGHLLSRTKTTVSGVTAGLTDALLPGFTCYSAGQACAGDMLDWFVNQSVPQKEYDAAARAGMSIHGYLEKQAARQRPGECRLVALDWWNGNRSILVNAALSGALIGMTMETTPSDIYRALLDSIAFGHREIVDNFTAHGLDIKRVILCGGIANKNKLLMQIMANVLGRDIHVTAETQATALGAAMCAATALGEASGGYASLREAVTHMRGAIRETFRPNPDSVAKYGELYAIYHRLYGIFGVDMPKLMASLRGMA